MKPFTQTSDVCTQPVGCVMCQEKTAERTSRAREQLLAARLRQEKLAEARRTVAALQSALEAGQTQVFFSDAFCHHTCFAAKFVLMYSEAQCRVAESFMSCFQSFCGSMQMTAGHVPRAQFVSWVTENAADTAAAQCCSFKV